jgi:hypothetical protein
MHGARPASPALAPTRVPGPQNLPTVLPSIATDSGMSDDSSGEEEVVFSSINWAAADAEVRAACAAASSHTRRSAPASTLT